MLRDGPLVAFVATTRPAQARHFYLEVLGLELSYEDNFALAIRVGPTSLRVTKVTPEQFQPVGYTVLGWEVPAVHAAIADLTRRGVVFERYPDWIQQDADGVWVAPGGAQVAWFKDPDGNTLSLTQMP